MIEANAHLQADLSNLPRLSTSRPDFQAPGPRVLIEEKVNLQDDESDDSDESEEIEGTSLPRIKYYESGKVLGKLYRAIDEHGIFERIQQYSRAPQNMLRAKQSPLDLVLKYVQDVTALIEWHHHSPWAMEIKEA